MTTRFEIILLLSISALLCWPMKTDVRKVTLAFNAGPEHAQGGVLQVVARRL